jgi:hypothetical protein
MLNCITVVSKLKKSGKDFDGGGGDHLVGMLSSAHGISFCRSEAQAHDSTENA